MTNEEKDLLIAYRVDAGDIDPECDVEAQFLEWYQVREQVVSGEVHYKALLQATRMRARSFEEGRRAGPGRGRSQVGLGPAGDQPRPPPLHGPCSRGGDLTPGNSAPVHQWSLLVALRMGCQGQQHHVPEGRRNGVPLRWSLSGANGVPVVVFPMRSGKFMTFGTSFRIVLTSNSTHSHHNPGRDTHYKRKRGADPGAAAHRQ